MLENRVPARYTELHVQPRNTGIIVPADNSFPLTDFHPISPRLEFIFDHDSDLINRYVLDYFLPFFFFITRHYHFSFSFSSRIFPSSRFEDEWKSGVQRGEVVNFDSRPENCLGVMCYVLIKPPRKLG